jgi:threonine efflux protein
MENLDSYLAIAVAFFIVAVSPGPANIAVATVAMHSGRRPGLLFGLGLSVGLAFWGVVAATGLGVMLQSTTTFLTVSQAVWRCLSDLAGIPVRPFRSAQDRRI